jgi:hypothetical protein
MPQKRRGPDRRVRGHLPEEPIPESSAEVEEGVRRNVGAETLVEDAYAFLLFDADEPSPKLPQKPRKI